MVYRCECCGELHKEWPAIAFRVPNPYLHLTDEEKEYQAKISSDFCIIEYSDQTDYFIRATLSQDVIDNCKDLEYGLWVSLSEKSFNDYYTNFKKGNHITSYFGWLSSYIPGYDSTLEIPTTVYTKADNQRPEMFPREGFDHPFVKDYYDGITKAEAERRIEEMLRHTGHFN